MECTQSYYAIEMETILKSNFYAQFHWIFHLSSKIDQAVFVCDFTRNCVDEKRITLSIKILLGKIIYFSSHLDNEVEFLRSTFFHSNWRNGIGESISTSIKQMYCSFSFIFILYILFMFQISLNFILFYYFCYFDGILLFVHSSIAIFPFSSCIRAFWLLYFSSEKSNKRIWTFLQLMQCHWIYGKTNWKWKKNCFIALLCSMYFILFFNYLAFEQNPLHALPKNEWSKCR